MRRAGVSTIDLGVFGISVVITVLAVTGAVLDFVIADFGWVFILSSFGFLAFSVYLALSRYGKIRLGGEDERLPREAPEPERAGTRPTGAPAPQQARAVEPESRS